MDHPVLTDIAAWQENEQEATETRQKAAVWLRGVVKRQDEYAAKRRQWEQQAAAAVMEGKPPPKAPPAPAEEPDVGPYFRAREEQLQQRREQLVRELSGQVEERGARRESELLELARTTPLNDWQGLLTEFAALLATVRWVRAATDHSDHSPERRTRRRITVGDLATAAWKNTSLLAPEPLRPEPGVPFEPDDDQVPVVAMRADGSGGVDRYHALQYPASHRWAQQAVRQRIREDTRRIDMPRPEREPAEGEGPARPREETRRIDMPRPAPEEPADEPSPAPS